MTLKQLFVYNTITNLKKVKKWPGKYNYNTQEKIGQVWYFGTADILKIKY